MRRQRIRFLLTFLSGIVAAVLVATLSSSVTSLAATRYEDLSLFTNVLNLVRRNYVEPIDEAALVRGAVRGMLEELDPHSTFLDSEAYREMQVDTRGQFHGLGIEITKSKDGFIEVVAPIDGTPASEAGIRPRDLIVSICPTEVPEDWTEDCRSTKSMTLFDAVQLMRGRKGTEITIEIFRDDFDAPERVTVVRDVVKVVSVSGRMLEPDYAYVRIRAFQERTIEDLQSVLTALHEESKREFAGLVLDMRDNPGGLLDQAVKVADAWLSDGLVVYTKGRVESQLQEFSAHRDGTEPAYPIAVLVNEGTASASEIVAGALQDQRRALVIGQKTFGKGSVQTVYPLEGDAGLRLTTALYYTPAGRSIQEVGIQPDIEVAAGAQGADGAAELKRRRLRESDLEGHFRHGETDDPQSAEPPPGPGADASDATQEEAPEDLQLARALEVLKSWTYFERLRPDAGPRSETSLQARAVETPSTAATP
ncbi:MAG: S41 family peptidase [Myxococcales bacterium]|nr:S41 family peptidase [Myxococcales bacterium]